MMKQACASIEAADVVFLVVEPHLPDENNLKDVLKPIIEYDCPVILVINKIDSLKDKSELLIIIEAYHRLYEFNEIIPISALKDENVQRLLNCTAALLPEGEPLFPTDIVSNQYERYFVAELIREKVFHNTHQEIPYSVAVSIDQFKEREQGKWYIRATLVVEKDNHKGMVIGKQGAMIKKIGQSARIDIETFLDAECFLDLFVKVIPDWKTNDKKLRELGYFIQ